MTSIAMPVRTVARSKRNRALRKLGARAGVTLFASALCLLFILPLIYMFSASFSDPGTQSVPNHPLWPSIQETLSYTDPETGVTTDVPVVDVPGHGHLGLVTVKLPGYGGSTFLDPATNKTLLLDVNTTVLEPVWQFHITFDNFTNAWDQIETGYPTLFRNTLVIAILGTIGATLSAIVVAYGFARFRIPGREVLFLVLIGTIMLPFQVVLIPQFIIFHAIGWTNSWLPLIVPHYFANAYNVFLLRQYFRTLPRELDEAAMMDGASPFRILTSVIIPQSWPAIMVVVLFHFFFAWNDFLGPLIYTSGNENLWPIAIGLNNFNATYRNAGATTTIQAGALIAIILPVVLFFLTQRVFMRGVVISGVEK